MSKYQLFTIKRYAEQALMFPFVLLGRLIALSSEKTEFDIFSLFPFMVLEGQSM